MIYYLPGGADHFPPSGGTKTHVQHVRILNELGFSAKVLHVTPGFRYEWIEEDYPRAYGPNVILTPKDFLVLNEIMGPVEIAPGIPKILFNQNCHYTFRGYPIPPTKGMYVPYTDPDVLGTMVLTSYCRDALRAAFPNHPITVIPHGIDGAKWVPGTKKKQIAFMPRKHPDEAQQVFGYLHYGGYLDGWDVVAIDGKTEAETAAILSESMVFFAFGYPEGGTLPPFEAMASGCVVVGYGGFSSDQWMKDFGGWCVSSADSMQFVAKAAKVLRWDFNKLVDWGAQSRDLVLEGLSPDKERAALYDFWRRLIAPVAKKPCPSR